MVKLFGYGEDFLTLWVLNEHIETILKKFKDDTASSDCLVFYRPSFGRRGGANSPEFGEFDAILASRENIYLIESKWDNLGNTSKSDLVLREEQILRHKIFSWYVLHWNKKYINEWETFVDDNKRDFEFNGKPMVSIKHDRKCLLAMNIEFVLSKLIEHCPQRNIKNVLLFFFRRDSSRAPSNVDKNFTLISIDYSREMQGNYIEL